MKSKFVFIGKTKHMFEKGVNPKFIDSLEIVEFF